MIVKKRKGISTFIATLLLMVLAVAAGVVIYAYVMGYLGGFTAPTQMGALQVDASSADITLTPPISVYLRNIGKATFVADTVYVNNIMIAKSTTLGWDFPAAGITEGAVGTLTIVKIPMVFGTTTTPAIGAAGFVGSTTYDIKIIGKDNTQLSFQIKTK